MRRKKQRPVVFVIRNRSILSVGGQGRVAAFSARFRSAPGLLKFMIQGCLTTAIIISDYSGKESYLHCDAAGSLACFVLNNPLAVDLVATVRLTYCLLASLAPPWEYLLASYGRWKASQGGKSGLLGIYET
jgi:hypothetical protein